MTQQGLKIGVFEGPGIGALITSLTDEGWDNDGFPARTISFTLGKVDQRFKWLGEKIRVVVYSMRKVYDGRGGMVPNRDEWEIEGIVVKKNSIFPIKQRVILKLKVYSSQHRNGAGRIFYEKGGNYDYLETPEEICTEIEKLYNARRPSYKEHGTPVEGCKKKVALSTFAREAYHLIVRLREMYFNNQCTEVVRKKVLDYTLNYHSLLNQSSVSEAEYNKSKRFQEKFISELLDTNLVLSLLKRENKGRS